MTGELKKAPENITLLTEVADIKRKNEGIIILKSVKNGVLFSISNKIFQMNYGSFNIRSIIDFREIQIGITEISTKFIPDNCYGKRL